MFDFCSIKNTILDSDTGGSGTELLDIMDTIEKQQYVEPDLLMQHFWNVFVEAVCYHRQTIELWSKRLSMKM